jgi:hypothetical protein
MLRAHRPAVSTDGGCVDNPMRWCDNLSNNDPKVLTFMSKAFATMVIQMAVAQTLPSGAASLTPQGARPSDGPTPRPGGSPTVASTTAAGIVRPAGLPVVS